MEIAVVLFFKKTRNLS